MGSFYNGCESAQASWAGSHWRCAAPERLGPAAASVSAHLAVFLERSTVQLLRTAVLAGPVMTSCN